MESELVTTSGYASVPWVFRGTAPEVHDNMPHGTLLLWKVASMRNEHHPHAYILHDGRVLIPADLNETCGNRKRSLWYYPRHEVATIELPSFEAAITTMNLLY